MSEWVRAFFYPVTLQYAKALTTLFQGFDTIGSDDAIGIPIAGMPSSHQQSIKHCYYYIFHQTRVTNPSSLERPDICGIKHATL